MSRKIGSNFELVTQSSNAGYMEIYCFLKKLDLYVKKIVLDASISVCFAQKFFFIKALNHCAKKLKVFFSFLFAFYLFF